METGACQEQFLGAQDLMVALSTVGTTGRGGAVRGRSYIEDELIGLDGRREVSVAGDRQGQLVGGGPLPSEHSSKSTLKWPSLILSPSQ